MKTNQQRKTSVAEKEEAAREVERPVWFLGKELKVALAKEEPAKNEATTDEADAKKAKKAAKKPDKVEKADKPAQPEEASGERRPSQLEAYMRYAKMRGPSSEEDEESLAPVRARKFPVARHTAGNENDMDWAGEAPRPRRPRREASYGFRMRDAVLAGVASIAIGALAGAVVYDRANDGELSTAVFDTVGGFMTGFDSRDEAIADAGKAGVSVAEDQNAAAAFKKPVTTARLDVSDAKGDVNTPIPLSISAEPAIPNQDIAFRLSGIPADAYLSAGTKLANNDWMLKPGEELGVKLMVPSVPASPLLIAVEAIEPRTGDLAAPSEEMKGGSGDHPPPAPAADAARRRPMWCPASAPPTDVKRNFNLPPAKQQEKCPRRSPFRHHLRRTARASGVSADSGLADAQWATSSWALGDFTAGARFSSARARELGNHEASLRAWPGPYDPVVFRDRKRPRAQGRSSDGAQILSRSAHRRHPRCRKPPLPVSRTWMKQ